MPSMVTAPEYAILLIALVLCCIAGLISGVLSYWRDRRESSKETIDATAVPSPSAEQ